MPAKLECPICLCSIKNKKTDFAATNCGHCYHASCLMRQVHMNGFSCPYCRNNMVGQVEPAPVAVRRVPVVAHVVQLDPAPVAVQPAPVVAPVVEEEYIIVRKRIIQGKRYLIDRNNNLYDYDEFCRTGEQVEVGVLDIYQNRVVERLIDV